MKDSEQVAMHTGPRDDTRSDDTPSRVIVTDSARQLLASLGLPAAETAQTVTLSDLLSALLNANPSYLWVAGFTADSGFIRTREEQLQRLVEAGALRMLVSTSALVTPFLAERLRGMLPGATAAVAEEIGSALFPVLRVAGQDEPRLHAKVYLFGLNEAGRTVRVAIVGSANPTSCGISRQCEVSVVLADDACRDSLDWLEGWYEKKWSEGQAYQPPPALPARATGEFVPLDFQEKVLDWLDEKWAAAPVQPRSVLRKGEVNLPGHLVVLPTGAGKTRLAMEWIAGRWREDDDIRVLWVTHLKELVKQTERHFALLVERRPEGRRYSDGEWRDGAGWKSPVGLEVMTRQKAVRLDRTEVDILVIDEAHHVGFANVQYPDILHNIRARMVIGLTATPWRTSVAGVTDSSLGELFPDNAAHRCEPVTLADVTAPESGPVLAHLVRHVVDTGLTMELSEDETTFRVSENNRTFERFLTRQAVRAVGTAWHPELGKTLVFALTKKHADAVADALRAEHRQARVMVIYSGQDPREQSITLKAFRTAKEGDPAILVSVAMLLEGLDFPSARTVMMARPTRSTLLYTQMLGRVLRGPAMGGTKYAYAMEFFVRTKEDLGASADSVRNNVFRRALLAPPSYHRTKNWDPAGEWGAAIDLPREVKSRVDRALRAMASPAERVEQRGSSSRAREAGQANVTQRALREMSRTHGWKGEFSKIAKMTGLRPGTLKQYANGCNRPRFIAWKDKNKDLWDDIRAIVAEFRTGTGTR